MSEHYTPRYDGIDGLEKLDREQTPYDGDDFTDRLDFSAELDSIIEMQDAPTVLHRMLTALNASFPGDLVRMQRDDVDVYAPWTTVRMSVLLGICDTIHSQLYRERGDGKGGIKTSGLLPQFDRGREKLKRLIEVGAKTDRIAFQTEYCQQVSEKIHYLEELANAAADVYDKAADKADKRGLLANWFPPVYQPAHVRYSENQKRNLASPMSPAEYEAWVIIGGKELADTKFAERQKAFAERMGAPTA